MRLLKIWIKASRLPSQSYIFMPLLTGQAFYLILGEKLDWRVFSIVHLYGLFMQLYIVYANDYADVETDKLNRTYTVFSGGSRVLADGELTRRALGFGSIVMAGLSLLMGFLLVVLFGRIWAPIIILFGISLLWLYSFKPVKQSYRGGGELLQMTGVGIVLPLLGYYAQSGEIISFPMETFMVILPTQLACAMATSIPDFLSDKQSRKRTAAVLLGQQPVRLAVIVLNLLSIIAMFIIGWAGFSMAENSFLLLILGFILILQIFYSYPTNRQRKTFLFVLLSIILTLGIMGQLAYVASVMKMHQ